MVWVVFNSGLLWSRYISRLSDLVATSGFGCFREFSSGFGKSNFAFMIVIVELHLGRELIFGRVNLVSMWKSLFLLGENGFCFGEVAILVGGIVILILRVII